MFTVCWCFWNPDMAKFDTAENSCVNPGTMVNTERVAILDADGQYCQIMDRCVRKLHIESDILPFTTTASNIKKWGYKAVVILGRSDLMHTQSFPKYDSELFKIDDLPVLGIDYGMQIMNREFGGKGLRDGLQEEGEFNVTVDVTCPLFRGLEKTQMVFATRSDSIMKVAPDFSACIFGCFCTAICNDSRRHYGLQFHPEIDLTTNGTTILQNFLREVSGLSGNYTLQARETETIEYIQRKVGSADDKVLLLFNDDGDLYNVTCAFLLCKVLPPERIVAVYVNSGLGRTNKLRELSSLLKDELGLDLCVVDVEEVFVNATTMVLLDSNEPDLGCRVSKELRHVTDTEEKRKIVTETFGAVLDGLGLDYKELLLVQPTLRSDLFPSTLRLISNRTNYSVNFNSFSCELLGKLKMAGRVLEPLKKFYESEIRDLARIAVLPQEIITSRPLPHTGFAHRIVCMDSAYIGKDFLETTAILRSITEFGQTESGNKLVDYIKKSTSHEERGILRRISRDFNLSTLLLPMKCHGNEGSIGYAVGISSEHEPDWDYLSFLARIIIRICLNVVRVCYIFGENIDKIIPAMVPTHLTRDVLDKVAQVDEAAMKVLAEMDANETIVRMPVVLIPVVFDWVQPLAPPPGKHSVVIRPTCTQDSVSLIPALPGKHFPLHVARQLAKRILDVPGISRVLYDLTAVTQSTVEWE